MAKAVINPRIRGFLCLTTHPDGCARNVQRQIEVARAGGPGKGVGNVLVVGSSAGYGLSSLITLLFGHGANALGVCFERPGNGEKPGSAGWYNLAEVHAQAKAAGRRIETINGDAFSTAVKQQAIEAIKARFAPIDYVVYSLASPKRTDPADGQVHASVLKPLGQAYTSKTVNLDSDQIQSITIQPANPAEIEATRKVMGGDDWKMWIDALSAAGVLAKGCRTVAYSYIGPQLTYPIYRSGTIGKAKEHLEATAKQLDASLKTSVGGAAYVSVNKALVTQASSAIPVVPLYISLLYRVMKERGTHEGTIEQMVRLYRDHLGPGKQPKLDADGRVRVDDWEMDPAVQAAVEQLWPKVETETLATLSDYAGFKREFRQLFGFEIDGIDYAQAVEVERALA
ncbi:MAG TPA: enoyl-ACP reductase FabV [Planctomycetota bacterium]|nr:enoyl-ACP reductase FabV [Planctomycetota bacterium]